MLLLKQLLLILKFVLELDLSVTISEARNTEISALHIVRCFLLLRGSKVLLPHLCSSYYCFNCKLMFPLL